jgi:UV DNA damage endonuclease
MSQNEYYISEEADYKGRVRLGLCCINNRLRKKGIFCSRSTIRKTFSVERAMDLALKNIQDIKPLVEWNEKNKINVFRLSSDMFPHFTDTETEKYSLDFAVKALETSGETCKKLNQRITMHPGQYNQIGAKTAAVFDKTVDDLKMHADILDAMGIDADGIVNIHGGGVYGDKEATKRRWIEQFDDLPANVKARLTIENCEKCYSTRDCLEIATECKIPVIFDTHHYDCYSLLHPNEKQESPEQLLPEVIETWGSRRPLFHISQQRPGSAIGAHSDYITEIPHYLLDIPFEYNTDIDIDVEAKAKEDAILSLYEKYHLV